TIQRFTISSPHNNPRIQASINPTPCQSPTPSLHFSITPTLCQPRLNPTIHKSSYPSIHLAVGLARCACGSMQSAVASCSLFAICHVPFPVHSSGLNLQFAICDLLFTAHGRTPM